jgi:sulfate permease, SulP family
MILSRGWPFRAWFPMTRDALGADVLAGITVALVLVPQAMAYAQLAGMPVQHGLYAAFLPVIVGALWGSSRHLASGPVAMTSLLTASVLLPLATAASEQYVALAGVLALLGGLVRIALGTFQLGVLVNFLSHPVLMGFTNAAAIIIALSQLPRLLGVAPGRGELLLREVWSVAAQMGNTHLPTLAMGVGALVVMAGLRWFWPRAPGVLIAVVAATAISWAVGFAHSGRASLDDVADGAVRALAGDYVRTERTIADIQGRIGERSAALRASARAHPGGSALTAAIRYQVEILGLELKAAVAENRARLRELRQFVLERASGPAAAPGKLYQAGRLPPGATSDGHRWRIRTLGEQGLELEGGGEVVGHIPAGMPSFALPRVSSETMVSLMIPAFVVALVGLAEAMSSAKAIAARTKQRLDPDQELIGQGLANVAASLSQAFPVSGSFSRSALIYGAGGRTGLASVVSAVGVLATIVYLTPLLYHLPQSMLAAIIIMAVVGLIDVAAMRHAWHADRNDGVAALVTFLATLGFAPHIDTGLLIGVGLALVLFLARTMKPRVAVLGRHPDGTLRDADLHGLPVSDDIAAVRFDGQLYFGNVSYFEDAILEVASRFPGARHILVAGSGINHIDASGEQAIRHLTRQLRESGITLAFSGLKHQVLSVLQRTGLLAEIGAENIFPSDDAALTGLRARRHTDGLAAARSGVAQDNPPTAPDRR